MKRGQVTLFIVLGIVILAMISIGLYMTGTLVDLQTSLREVEASKALEQAKDVQKFVDDCIFETMMEIIPQVFRNGGYYILPEKNVAYLHYNVPIYMENGTERIPLKKDLAREIALGIDTRLPFCLSEINEFADVTISGNPESEVELSSFRIKVDLRLPLILKGEVTSKLVKFSASSRLNVLSPYEEAMEVYTEVKGVKGFLPFSRLATLASTKDYTFSFDEVDDVQLYLLSFNKTLINDQPLEYTFGVYNPLSEGEPILDGEDDFSLFFS